MSSAPAAPAPSTPVRVSKRTRAAKLALPARSCTPPAYATPGAAVPPRPVVPDYALPPPARLQPGRQASSRRILAYLESPTRLADGPLLQNAATRRRRRHTHLAVLQGSSRPASVVASGESSSNPQGKSPPAVPRQAPERSQTLLDIAMQEYEASMASGSTTQSTSGAVIDPGTRSMRSDSQ